VAAVLDDLEGQVNPMGLDPLEHRDGNVDIRSAEQHLRRSLERLPIECASQQDRRRQAQVGPVRPRAGHSAGAIAELVGIHRRSMQLRRKRFDHPDEIRTVEKARIELVELGELAVGRAIFEPGWRWSEQVKPIVDTESCQVHHLGYVVSGHLHVEMTDGASLEVMRGDAFEIPPGHDAWVIATWRR
jgi:hypothetical protein